MKRATTTIVGLTLAAGVFGCGESDEDKARSAIEDTYQAFAKVDVEKFCDGLSSDYRPDFEEYYEGKCDEPTIQKALRTASGPGADRIGDPDISKVTINGDEAEAEVNGDDLELVKEDGEWKLDDFDVPGGS